MAGTSFLALLDDIAIILDDIAVMTKVATKKTAGVLADDLALNAEQAMGLKADRELPVIWAVAKGSLKNKLILVPSALAISAFAPWAVTPIMILGGAFLCYEGFEKISHKFLHSKAEDCTHHAELVEAHGDATVDLVAFEKNKIRGAIRTDFILSAEIIVITLGIVAAAPFAIQVAVLSFFAVALTVVVYGLVASIIKLDNAGLFLSQKNGDSLVHKVQSSVGLFLLWVAPVIMKGLSIVGTAAMFLVGGGILTHGIPWISQLILQLTSVASTVPGVGGILNASIPTLLDALIGVLFGSVILFGLMAGKRIWRAAR